MRVCEKAREARISRTREMASVRIPETKTRTMPISHPTLILILKHISMQLQPSPPPDPSAPHSQPAPPPPLLPLLLPPPHPAGIPHADPQVPTSRCHGHPSSAGLG